MRKPLRRVLSFRFLAPGTRTSASGARTIEIVPSCKHTFDTVLLPDKSGSFQVPQAMACPFCPDVPDARFTAYVEGGMIPEIGVVR